MFYTWLLGLAICGALIGLARETLRYGGAIIWFVMLKPSDARVAISLWRKIKQTGDYFADWCVKSAVSLLVLAVIALLKLLEVHP
jgi:hypothetical protein